MISFILFLSLYILWLCLCIPFCSIGLLLSKTYKKLEPDHVEQQETICKILNSKGLLSNEEYDFEVNKVAPFYNASTFKGYKLIVHPLIKVLKNFHFMDSFVLSQVKRWMKVHHYFFDQTIKPAPHPFFIFATQLSTQMAYGMGQFLNLFIK